MGWPQFGMGWPQFSMGRPQFSMGRWLLSRDRDESFGNMRFWDDG
jgi:hypothetical protein